MSWLARRALSVALALSSGQLCLAFEPFQWNLPKGFPKPKVPPANPMSADKVALGRRLFYDKRLSADGTMSCATCHRQELAFTDGRVAAVGVTGVPHPRSAMSLVNVAYSSTLTWSNPRMTTLEEQALVPLLSEHPVEMGLKGIEERVLNQFRADGTYRILFGAAFPVAPPAVSLVHVAQAIAAFERTIISGRSPYDRFLHDGDSGALSEAAKRGELLFFNSGTAGCYRCHGGFNFTDSTDKPNFHNTGLYNLPGFSSYPEQNPGLYTYTSQPADMGKFKTPTLRNIAVTAPYMHDGSVATLEEVLDHYEAGGRTIHSGSYCGDGSKNPAKDPLVSGFSLTRQSRQDLIALLNSLTDKEVLTDPSFSDPWAR